MANGALKEVASEVKKVMFSRDYAPERGRAWNVVWYASMTTLYCSNNPLAKGLGLLCGLYSTYSQQKNMYDWMRTVSDKLDKKW